MLQNYSNLILDHYHLPRNFGILKSATHIGDELNPLCGDEIKVYLKVREGQIRDLRYEACGCALSIAAASMLSENIINRKIGEIGKVGLANIKKMLGVEITPAREQCAMLALNTIKKALRN